jgi:hypothetical protein
VKRSRARRVALGVCALCLTALTVAFITTRDQVLDHCYLKIRGKLDKRLAAEVRRGRVWFGN